MQITKCLFAMLVACFGTAALQSQQAPSIAPHHEKALEVLRQKLAEERGTSAEAMPYRMRTPEPSDSVSTEERLREIERRSMEAMQGRPPRVQREETPSWGPIHQPTSPVHERALEALRRAMAEERQAGTATATATMQPPVQVPSSQGDQIEETRPARVQRPAAPRDQVRSPEPIRVPSTRVGETQEPLEMPEPTVTQAPVQPAPVLTPAPAPEVPRVKSKQEQLRELLEEYKADKITPGQYQERRARILAQP